MTNTSEEYQKQFSGFFNTPHLFNSPVNGLEPYTKKPENSFRFHATINPKVRLGQRVERFVTAELLQLPNLSVLVENCQIKNELRTIGELDCLFLDHAKPIHLEIQFKFYLYDPSLGTSEIDHCIGPMRRDTLNEKLNKLKNHQLPLLYAPETKPLLDCLELQAEDITQKIYFKAQLFLPLGESVTLKTLNPNCVYGFYFHYDDLEQFEDCKFYCPKKTDWLLDVSPAVHWQTYLQILPKLMTYKSEGYSPLIWLKKPNGELSKCFVVAW
ncbi:DUF1853 family protein [Bizionia paragorgiae]|uniref:DUF1853 family protein n=1 Tax=Bizionia paragorgiae TaxID=283786 RepID=UPI00299EF9B4|nr:DUF1853 family protein [Bizionia paragorgiae]MDX1271850.1 DUF1853 family protein [Bizionia paragorgiae]